MHSGGDPPWPSEEGDDGPSSYAYRFTACSSACSRFCTGIGSAGTITNGCSLSAAFAGEAAQDLTASTPHSETYSRRKDVSGVSPVARFGIRPFTRTPPRDGFGTRGWYLKSAASPETRKSHPDHQDHGITPFVSPGILKVCDATRWPDYHVAENTIWHVKPHQQSWSQHLGTGDSSALAAFHPSSSVQESLCLLPGTEIANAPVPDPEAHFATILHLRTITNPEGITRSTRVQLRQNLTVSELRGTLRFQLGISGREMEDAEVRVWSRSPGAICEQRVRAANMEACLRMLEGDKGSCYLRVYLA